MVKFNIHLESKSVHNNSLSRPQLDSVSLTSEQYLNVKLFCMRLKNLLSYINIDIFVMVICVVREI